MEASKMIPMMVGCMSIAGGAVGVGHYIDNRYELRSHAQQTRQDDERGRLESQLEVYQLKLDFLLNKTARTPQDDQEIHYLEDVIAKIRQRLKGLE
jgi:hypothetical protein